MNQTDRIPLVHLVARTVVDWPLFLRLLHEYGDYRINEASSISQILEILEDDKNNDNNDHENYTFAGSCYDEDFWKIIYRTRLKAVMGISVMGRYFFVITGSLKDWQHACILHLKDCNKNIRNPYVIFFYNKILNIFDKEDVNNNITDQYRLVYDRIPGYPNLFVLF